MSPFEILGQLMSTVLKFVPRLWWCPAYVGGVLFVRGTRILPFGGGLVFWFPLWTTMLTCPVVRQVMDIEAQTMTTKDGKSVIVAGVVAYCISDHRKYLTENYQAEHSVEEAVAACLREVIVDRTWAEAHNNDRNTTDNALTREAGKLLEAFGITVERVRLTSMAQAKVINIVGGAVGVVPDEEEVED